MTTPAFNPDDPRLTAFVLGEIGDSDRAEIEQLLETSPAAQAAVKEIEETIGVLKEGLSSEPVPALTAEQRAAVEEQLAGPTVSLGPEFGPPRRSSTGRLVGGFLSFAALGVMAALIFPSVNRARQSSQFSSDEVAATTAPDRAALNSMGFAYAESEESAEFAERTESLNVSMVTAEVKAVNRESSTSKEGDAFSSGLGQQVAANSTASRSNGFPGASTARPTTISGSGRRENNFSNRDGAQPALTSPAKNPADFDRASKSKDLDGARSAQRLIADSRSGVNNSRQGSGKGQTVGLSVARPKSEPQPTSASPAGSSGQSAKPASGGRPAPVLTARGKPASTEEKSRMVRKPGEGAPSSLIRGKKVAAATASAPVGADGLPAVRNKPAETPLPAVPVTSNSQSLVTGKNKRGSRKGVVVNGTVVELTDSVKDGKGKSETPTESKKRVLFLESVDSKAGKKLPAPGQPVAAGEVLKVLDREEALHKKKSQPALPEQQDGAEKDGEKPVQFAAIDKARIEAAKQASRRDSGLEADMLKINLDAYERQLGQVSAARKRSFGFTRPNFGNETYEPIVENDFIVPEINDKEKRLSTISVDVDTASYSNMRRFLNRDQLPPPNSVRIEELVNYFKYDYPEPEGNDPFSVKTELASCPWQPNHRLALVGLKGKTIDKAQRPPTNLVFLLDVSGSMRSSNKLPLVQQSMRLLVEEMTEDDRISIVTYASKSGVRLQSTLGSKKAEILNVINGLRAGGSTNGEGGIRMAYDQANRHYFQGGANRVILCSDGDFNVGKSSDGELVELIQEKAASGVFLSVFGFGMGNLKDAKLEKLADKGNGHYGYIDNVKEAEKVFQDELVGTLYTIAKDVKLQVEFNPATVGAYRLIGYENRKLAAQDFTDDTKDAGEIGSGHTVTALYEIIPKDILLERPRIDGLKYQSTPKKDAPEAPPLAEEATDPSKELFTVKLRYKKPDEEVSTAVENDYPVQDVAKSDPSLANSSDDLVFAASVASFGMNLRGSKYRGNWGFAEALESAQGAPGKNDAAQRAEFIQLVQRAMRITGQQVGPQPRTDQGPVTRPGELGGVEARIKAAVGGKYRRLVKKIEVRDDFRRFGAFSDYGHWDGTEYSGHKDLLPGHWVYVYPNWYIWAEAVVPAAESAAPKAEPAAPKAEDKPAVK